MYAALHSPFLPTDTLLRPFRTVFSPPPAVHPAFLPACPFAGHQGLIAVWPRILKRGGAFYEKKRGGGLLLPYREREEEEERERKLEE